MVLSIISSIFSALLVGFAIAIEVHLFRYILHYSGYKGFLAIALYVIQILIGLLEFAIAIAATACSCRVVCSGTDHSGSVHPGVVHSGSVYPGSVYPGSVYPGAFVYQNSGSAYQYPGKVMQSSQMAAPQMAASQMAAPQMAAPQMAAPQMAAHEMAAPKLDEPQIQIQEV